MRIAALYDIHGNLPALEAVLEDVRDEEVDEIVVGGDVVPGPMPRASLERLLELDVPVRFIHGNGDREVVACRRGGISDAVPEQAREALQWSASQLDDELEQVLAGWPATLEMTIDGPGDVLFCHASPRNDTEIFTRRTPEEVLVPVFAGIDARLVVCGHTHMQFDRTVRSIRLVNAGSVGMPFGSPGADWLLLGPGIELRHTDYDLSAAAARVRATAYPQAEAFAAGNILEPPSEESMLAAFGNAELAS